MPEVVAAIQGATRSDEPNQLQLRFFAVIDGFTRRPPERALWRVLIDTALAKTEVFRLRGRAISAEAVHHVALALYMQADPAGVIHDATEEHIAEQCRMGKRHVSLARQVLNDLRVVRSVPRRGRQPGVHRMNLGGLDWPAVRRRAGKPRPELVSESQAAVQPELVPGPGAPDDDRCGALGAPQSAPDDDRCGALGAPQTPRCGALGAPNGLRTIGLPDPERAGRHGSPHASRAERAREPAGLPDEPASEQQVAMLMTLQRKQRLPSQRVSEEEARTWTRTRISETLSELENLEERRRRRGALAAGDEDGLRDWVPAVNPDANPAAVTDWRCAVDRAARRRTLAVQRQCYVNDGLAAGITDPEAEIEIVLGRSER